MMKADFIDELLDGVEVVWTPLGEVADYEQPTKYLVKSQNYSDDFKTPVLTAGKTFILGYTDETNGIYNASKNPVIIFDDFTTANKWVDFDFKAKSSAMKMITSKNESVILLRYIYHWINTLPSGLIEGDHKRQWISNYSYKLIPIPPLNIQAEIVRILDTFTELTAELTAELAARKKQYNYYREQLLTFEEGEVEWERLGDVGEFIRGKRFVKTDIILEGVPCIHYGEMYTHYNIWAGEAKSYISEELAIKLRKATYGDVVMVAAGETIEDIGRGTAWLGDEDIVIHDACFFYKSSLNPKYVAYYTRTKSFHDQIRKSISSGKISAINAKGFEKVIIPVPSPDEQARIVSILDKFDALTSSITEGLPREIELRQKQYEYYRNMLLSFPKEGV
ncbi:restriction endonuclease subunit S [Listeria monocytogenes]|nr:restriction endonuclease subunit S [Listeria monocytogenes]EAF9011747.1 restriction endonuclease subunit S [Listeria monocytogenes]EAF9053795.1 restriction endonuclease subunit S [Listeria monocytogenes]EAF9077977.1 restriction endonuclease subunit S [Listeria monocytogenes]